MDANELKSNGLIYMKEPNWALYKGATTDTDGTQFREITVLVPLPFTFMQNTGSSYLMDTDPWM